jgi:hypothetical protein
MSCARGSGVPPRCFGHSSCAYCRRTLRLTAASRPSATASSPDEAQRNPGVLHCNCTLMGARHEPILDSAALHPGYSASSPDEAQRNPGALLVLAVSSSRIPLRSIQATPLLFQCSDIPLPKNAHTTTRKRTPVRFRFHTRINLCTSPDRSASVPAGSSFPIS